VTRGGSIKFSGAAPDYLRVTRAARLGYVPALDGLRGVAILLVVGRHAFLTPYNGGYGVDLFFVLSGYLITTLLLEERDRSARISLRAFYVRRARRLLPALAFMLACYLAAMAAVGHAAVAARETAAAGFYTANVVQAWWPHVIGRSAIGPLWSLAQEEQFYLVFPLLLIAMLKWRGETAMRRLVIGGVLLVTIERLALFLFVYLGSNSQRLYAGPDTHSDGLMLGALLALTLRRSPGSEATRADRFLGPASALLLGLLTVSSRIPWAVGISFVNLAAVGLVCATACQPNAPLTRALRWRPLVGLGKISYSLYLWNALLLFANHGDAAGDPHYRGTLAAVDVAAAVGVSWLSYRFVEQRFRRRRDGGTVAVRLRPAPQPVLEQAAQ